MDAGEDGWLRQEVDIATDEDPAAEKSKAGWKISSRAEYYFSVDFYTVIWLWSPLQMYVCKQYA